MYQTSRRYNTVSIQDFNGWAKNLPGRCITCIVSKYYKPNNCLWFFCINRNHRFCILPPEHNSNAYWKNNPSKSHPPLDWYKVILRYKKHSFHLSLHVREYIVAFYSICAPRYIIPFLFWFSIWSASSYRCYPTQPLDTGYWFPPLVPRLQHESSSHDPISPQKIALRKTNKSIIPLTPKY